MSLLPPEAMKQAEADIDNALANGITLGDGRQITPEEVRSAIFGIPNAPRGGPVTPVITPVGSPASAPPSPPPAPPEEKGPGRDELLAALGLDLAPELTRPAAGAEAPVGWRGAEARSRIKAERAEGDAPPSPTALEVDEWELRKGREVLAANPRIVEALLPGAGYSKMTKLQQQRYESKLERGYRLTPEERAASEATADLHAAAFQIDPALKECPCTDPVRKQFLEGLMQTDEYRVLHTKTMLESDASDLAAAAFAEQLVALKKQQKPGQGPPPGVQATRAALAACRQATEDVNAMHDMAAMLGLEGQAAVKANFKKLKNDPKLRRICELAGRFRRVAQSRQRQKTTHGVDDVVGVEPTGNPARLLAVERARLGVACPALRHDAYRRLLEKEMLGRKMLGVEQVGRGPIVVVVDESGSMNGEKIATAKALALAMAWVARHQGRWVALVAFSDGPQHRSVVLKPREPNQDALLAWLGGFIGGGTSHHVPFGVVPFDLYQSMQAPKGKTDMLVISDGCFNFPEPAQRKFLAWKQEAKARCTILSIEDSPGEMANVGDEVYRVPAIDHDSEEVGQILSV
jgi:uncharacterized protein with von Willebrand factor type A (vWA) domain